jgi:hypothetical protein
VLARPDASERFEMAVMVVVLLLKVVLLLLWSLLWSLLWLLLLLLCCRGWLVRRGGGRSGVVAEVVWPVSVKVTVVVVTVIQ